MSDKPLQFVNFRLDRDPECFNLDWDVQWKFFERKWSRLGYVCNMDKEKAVLFRPLDKKVTRSRLSITTNHSPAKKGATFGNGQLVDISTDSSDSVSTNVDFKYPSSDPIELPEEQHGRFCQRGLFLCSSCFNQRADATELDPMVLPTSCQVEVVTQCHRQTTTPEVVNLSPSLNSGSLIPTSTSSSPVVRNQLVVEPCFLSSNVFEILSEPEESDNVLDTLSPPCQEGITTTVVHQPHVASVIDAPFDSDDVKPGHSPCHYGTSISDLVGVVLDPLPITTKVESVKTVPVTKPPVTKPLVPVTKSEALLPWPYPAGMGSGILPSQPRLSFVRSTTGGLLCGVIGLFFGRAVIIPISMAVQRAGRLVFSPCAPVLHWILPWTCAPRFRIP